MGRREWKGDGKGARRRWEGGLGWNEGERNDGRRVGVNSKVAITWVWQAIHGRRKEETKKGREGERWRGRNKIKLRD